MADVELGSAEAGARTVAGMVALGYGVPLLEAPGVDTPAFAANQLLLTVTYGSGIYGMQRAEADTLDTDPHQIFYTAASGDVTALDVAASRLIGRKSTGDIDDLTGAESGEILFGTLTADRALGVDSGAALIQRTAAQEVAFLLTNLVGPFEFPIYPGDMIARTTNGAVRTSLTESTTNKVMRDVWAFDPTTTQYVQFELYLPKAFNAGTITFRYEWAHAAASNFGVVMGLQARAFTNDDAMDQAFGTAVTVTDTGGTTDDDYISPESTAVTIAGTPTGQKVVRFQLYRDVNAGGDTMSTANLYLEKVIVTLTMNNISDI